MRDLEYDVFISYSHSNKEWVTKELLPKLESHNFRVSIDFRDFREGAFSVDEMERAVVQSRHVLIVMSKGYFLSEWSKFENVMAQTLDPAAEKRKIIPILIEDCEIPLRLQILHYRDFRAASEDVWQRLLQSLI